MRSEALGRLSGIATVQWGLFSARQAMTDGVTRWDLSRLVGDGAIEQLGHGVYRMAGAPIPTLQDMKVAWLQLEPGVIAEDRLPGAGVVSHTSAARLYGVGDFEPDIYEFTRPVRFRTRRSDVVVHVAQLAAADVRQIDQLIVTTPVRLVADLLAERHDGEHVGQVCADLISFRQAGRRELSAAAAPYASAYGLAAGDGSSLIGHLMALVGNSRPVSARRTA